MTDDCVLLQIWQSHEAHRRHEGVARETDGACEAVQSLPAATAVCHRHTHASYPFSHTRVLLCRFCNIIIFLNIIIFFNSDIIDNSMEVVLGLRHTEVYTKCSISRSLFALGQGLVRI